MNNTEIKQKLSDIKQFVIDFTRNMTDTEVTDSAKQVFFLDTQEKVKYSMETLTGIKSDLDALGIELQDGSEEQQIYELSSALMNKLTKTLTDYKNSYSGVKTDVTVEDTTAIVTAETISEAAKSNTSTQKMIKDMNELNEKATVSQLQEFTHALLVGKKFVYVNAATKEELNTVINQTADANPNEKISVYHVSLTPIQLKTKTTYTV